MPHAQYPTARSAVTGVPRVVPRAALAMGGLGALIGGAAAAAQNIRRVKNAEIKREEAVRDTIREAAGTGLATTAATAVVGAAGTTGLLSLVGVLVVATGTKYLWDAATTSGKITIPESKTAKSDSEKNQPALA